MNRLSSLITSFVPKRLRDDRGATMLEWCLLLAAVVIPAWVIIRIGLATLAGHYGLVTTMNQMPFP
ncbi:MAG: hypothetical protein AAF085_07415 [Planctomycetota bacterium]